jgi:hypothetical protein
MEMVRPIVNPGELLWTGQHWINYIRPPGAQENSGMVSLWHTHYCEAGEGTVAYVNIQVDRSYQYICTDNEAIAAYIQTWMSGRGGLYDMDMPVVEATFVREGDIRSSPTWIIETSDDQIVAKWEALQPPVILEAPAPKFHESRDVYSYLFFADVAHQLLNGHLIPGDPYITDIWQPSIGGDRSSCVFALSETFIQVPG